MRQIKGLKRVYFSIGFIGNSHTKTLAELVQVYILYLLYLRNSPISQH